jgi:FSR family fosmidomycin resistance protein-like MFS transporter
MADQPAAAESLPLASAAEATPAQAGIAQAGAERQTARRTLLVSCGAHVLHDGYADLLYLLLPIWRIEFGLGYAAVGLMRVLYVGAMAGFQIPVGLLAERMGGRVLLVLGTGVAAAAFLLAGASTGFPLLALALLCGGLGASVQHPIASSLVSRAFERSRSRGALATYNFAGDLGKMAFPAIAAGLLLVMPWRPAVLALGLVGLAGAAAIWLLLPARQATAALPAGAAAGSIPDASAPVASAPGPASVRAGGARHGFPLLLSIGVIDSATRMGFFTFLPFLLQAKGAQVSTLGLALTLVFAGGAVGKLVCGFLGARLGVLATVFLTEGLTAAGIVALLPLPLEAGLALLPLIGIALNGTSSVLYGTVPELVAPERRERAFGIFYTGTIGGGATSPALYGLVSDMAGVPAMMGLVAGVVLLTLPLAWALRPALGEPGLPGR